MKGRRSNKRRREHAAHHLNQRKRPKKQANLRKDVPKLDDLKEIYERYRNSTGNKRSEAELICIVQLMAYLLEKNTEMTCNQMLHVILEIYGESKSTWRNLWISFQKNDSVDMSDIRGLVQEPVELNDDLVDQVITFAYEYTIQNNTCFTSVDLQHHLRASLDIELTSYEISSILDELGFGG